MSDRIIITVLGKDRTGIVSTVSSTLAKLGANVEDLSSTKMHGLFVMIVSADISKCRKPLKEIQEELSKNGKRIGVQVVAQHEDIFKYMHRI